MSSKLQIRVCHYNQWSRRLVNVYEVKVKVCAFIAVPHTQGAQTWIMQFHLQITPCLPLPRKRSPDGAYH